MGIECVSSSMLNICLQKLGKVHYVILFSNHDNIIYLVSEIIV